MTNVFLSLTFAAFSAFAGPAPECESYVQPALVSSHSAFLARLHYRGQPERALQQLHRKFGAVIQLEDGPLIVSDMRMIQALAVKTKDIERDWWSLAPYLGKESFFISENYVPEENTSWQTVFDAIRPQLRQKAVEAQSGRLKHAVKSALDSFMSDADPDEILLEDFSFYMAFASAMRFLFDYVPSKREVDIMKKRADGIFRASKFLYDGKMKRMGNYLSEMARQIEAHGEFHSSPTSIYAALRKAHLEKSKTDPSYNMQWLRDQIKTVIWASFETTQSLIATTVFFAARNPDWQEKIRQAYIASGEKPPERDRTITAFINESLRLYPPIPNFARTALEDFVVSSSEGNYLIKKGTMLILNLYASHRDSDVWGRNAHFFRPERWLQTNADITTCKIDDAHLILPFGAGARRCIGQFVALGEVANILGEMLTHYKIKIDSSGVPLDYDGTLRPQWHGVMRLKPRN